MNAFLQLMKFDLKLYFRDYITIFWVLIYPVLMLAIFGSMYGDQPGFEEGTRFIDYYVPALCVLNVISVSVFTLNINIITQRESGVLRRYRVSPVRKTAVLASHSLQGVILVILGAIEIIAVSKLIWDVNIEWSGFALLFCCLLYGCLCFFSIGFAISGLAKSAGAGSGLAMIIFFPMLFLSGIMMPIELLPSIMQSISDWLPGAYFVTLAQQVWLGDSVFQYGKEIAVVFGAGVICFALAIWLFKWEN